MSDELREARETGNCSNPATLICQKCLRIIALRRGVLAGFELRSLGWQCGVIAAFEVDQSAPLKDDLL